MSTGRLTQFSSWRPLVGAVALSLVVAGCSGDDGGGTHNDVSGGQDTDIGGGQDADTGGGQGPSLTLESPVEGEIERPDATILFVGVAGLSAAEAADAELEVVIDGGSRYTPTIASDGRFTQAVPFDDDDQGPHEAVVTVTLGGRSATITRGFIINEPPDKPVVTVTPANPIAGQDLTASATAADTSTRDGAPLTYTYAWASGNTPLGASPTLAAADYAGYTQLTVTVFANDGWEDGPSMLFPVAIGASAPTCDAALLTPSGATTSEALTCACTEFNSPLGGEPAVTCAFMDGNTVVQADGDCTLAASETAKGMAITCTVTPRDSTGAAGTPVTSASATAILDTPPTNPVVALTPADATAASTLTCEATVLATDADGDVITYDVRWNVDGAPVGGVTTPTATAVELGATGGQVVTCELNAKAGGDESGWTESAATTLLNSPPKLPSVLLTSAPSFPPTEADTLTCDVSQGSDPDGEALTATYKWFIGGAEIAGATAATLTGADFDRGDAISCQATLCDPHGACTAAVTSKTAATIQNSLPTIVDVTVGGGADDGTAEPGDTLTCTPSGWSDLDGDAEAYVFRWYVTPEGGTATVISGATSDSYDVSAALADGATVTCEVIPVNGSNQGSPHAASGGVVVVPPSAVAPVVAVSAPSGADGDVTCEITTAGESIPAGATWTWRWSLSGGDTFDGEQILTEDQVMHCDLVACSVAIQIDATTTITSNQATRQLAVGSDCDDGNPCTNAVCLTEGGCNAAAVSGPSCDDGDPCTVDGVCSSGVCTANTFVCTEDRLSVSDVAHAGPDIVATGDGGYAVHWLAGNSRRLRLTDGTASRMGLEARGTYKGSSFGSRPAPSPDGRVSILGCNVTLYPGGHGQPPVAQQPVYLARYDRDGAFIDESEVASVAQGSDRDTRSALLGVKLSLLGFSDGGFASFVSHLNKAYISGDPSGNGVSARPINSNLSLQDPVVIIPWSDLRSYDNWVVAPVVDGTDQFIVAWVAKDGITVKVQRFSKDVTEVDSAPITVTTHTALVASVHVASFRNGRFVVAWDAEDLDGSGRGIMAQRFDDAGSPLAAPFQATGGTDGDQKLGGVAALEDYRFVVVYTDVPGGALQVRAQRFTPTGEALGAPITINGRADVGSLLPTVASLGDNEWVAAWIDTTGSVWTRRYNSDGEVAPRIAARRAAETTVGDQRGSTAAREAGGNTLIVWSSEVYPDFGDEIMGRVFDADGVATGPEQVINTELTGTQRDVAIAGGPDRFVVAWMSDGEDGSYEGVFARRLDGTGAPLGEPFLVNATTEDYQRQPAVAMNDTGTTAIAFSGYGTSSDIFVRFFDADGGALGDADILVNNTTAGSQERPMIASIPFTDTFVVTWQSSGQDGSGTGICMRKVKADGTMLSPELRVNTVTDGDQRTPTIAIAQNDVTAICFASVVGGATDVICQNVKTSNMAGQGAPYTVHEGLEGAQEAPKIAWLTSGRLMVVYATQNLDHDGFAVQSAQFDNLGTRVAPRRTINRYWDSNQGAPWLVAYDDAVFVGYQSDTQDGDADGVYFRVLPLP